MAYIKQVAVDEAEGVLAGVYKAAVDRAGSVANIICVMSCDGPSANASMGFYVAVMKTRNSLSGAQKEMLAAVVSNANDCYYWTLSHARDFGLESGNEEAAQALIVDYRKCGFSEPDIALCEYAVELTLWPGDSSQANIDTLRQQGFSDEQITAATQVISYFNYINRIADGLGVDPEDWMTISVDQWLAEKPIWRSVF